MREDWKRSRQSAAPFDASAKRLLSVLGSSVEMLEPQVREISIIEELERLWIAS